MLVNEEMQRRKIVKRKMMLEMQSKYVEAGFSKLSDEGSVNCEWYMMC